MVLPEGVAVSMESSAVSVTGKLGSLRVPLLPHTAAERKEREIVVSKTGSTNQANANWGTMRSLLKNAVLGVTLGFTKTLEIEGVGFRAAMEGKNISLSLGYAHPVKFEVPDGVTASVEKNTIVKFTGIDKELVGEVAAKFRALKKPEPYKGKGIRYQGEVIRRKAGKKVASAA